MVINDLNASGFWIMLLLTVVFLLLFVYMTITKAAPGVRAGIGSMIVACAVLTVVALVYPTTPRAIFDPAALAAFALYVLGFLLVLFGDDVVNRLKSRKS